MAKENTIILIAGGSGFLGKTLRKDLAALGEIRTLTRDKQNKQSGFYHWNPDQKEIDPRALEGVTHLINLCGAPIADKRWTEKRKKELYDSRIEPARFLFSLHEKMSELKHYISASGINCYDFHQRNKTYTETDPIANDFVSRLVADWEKQADQFQSICKVVKLRISFVISSKGGSLEKLEKPIKMGFASILGSGEQAIPWIHISDLSRMVAFAITEALEGVYHACAGNTTNREITTILARKNGRRIWMPAAPAFVLKLILGELSVLVLEGIKASNDKIKKAGFTFEYSDLEATLLEK